MVSVGVLCLAAGFCPVVMGCRPLVKLGTSQRLAVWRVAFVGAERSRDTPL